MTSPGAADADPERIRRAHLRLRKASQDYAELAAPEALRGRWDPTAAPAGALRAAHSELERAYAEVVRLHEGLLAGHE